MIYRLQTTLYAPSSSRWKAALILQMPVSHAHVGCGARRRSGGRAAWLAQCQLTTFGTTRQRPCWPCEDWHPAGTACYNPVSKMHWTLSSASDESATSDFFALGKPQRPQIFCCTPLPQEADAGPHGESGMHRQNAQTARWMRLAERFRATRPVQRADACLCVARPRTMGHCALLLAFAAWGRNTCNLHKLPTGCGLQGIFVPQDPSSGQVCDGNFRNASDKAARSWLPSPACGRGAGGEGLPLSTMLRGAPGVVPCFSCKTAAGVGQRPSLPCLSRKRKRAENPGRYGLWVVTGGCAAHRQASDFLLVWLSTSASNKADGCRAGHKKIARRLHAGRFCRGQLVNQAASSGQNFNSGNRKIQPARLKGNVKVGIPNGVVRAAMAP